MTDKAPPAWKAFAPTSIPFHEIITAKEVRAWFEEALNRDDPHPTAEAYEQLARDLDRISRPAVIRDIEKQLELQIGTAARGLKKAIEDYQEFAGSGGALHLDEILALLPNVTYLAPREPRAGRKPEAWHKAGREIAKMIKSTLAGAGYPGLLNEKKEDSAVAAIGALAAQRAFGLAHLEAAGFAQAMRPRDRAKG